MDVSTSKPTVPPLFLFRFNTKTVIVLSIHKAVGLDGELIFFFPPQRTMVEELVSIPHGPG